MATVTEALSKAPRFLFTEEGDAWTQLSTTDMSPVDLAAAQSAWKETDGLEFADDEGEEQASGGTGFAIHLPPTPRIVPPEVNTEI